MKGLRIRCIRDDWQASRLIRLVAYHDRAAAQPLEFKPIEDGALLPVVASLDAEAAQGLIDSLWDCGFRPTEGTGSTGAMAATVKHLEDFRAITAKTLKVKLP